MPCRSWSKRGALQPKVTLEPNKFYIAILFYSNILTYFIFFIFISIYFILFCLFILVYTIYLFIFCFISFYLFIYLFFFILLLPLKLHRNFREYHCFQTWNWRWGRLWTLSYPLVSSELPELHCSGTWAITGLSSIGRS